MNTQTGQEKIGQFIKDLRLRKQLTQTEFAKALETSQSAVARIESGNQNLTTSLLEKISDALNHKIVSLSDNTLDFRITGGKKLSGSIQTNTSKNGSVALLCASLLNKGTTTLHGIARIEEVYRVIEILQSIDIDVKWTDDNILRISPPKEFAMDELDIEAARRVRSSLMMIGPLSHALDTFNLPHAGGCKMGERTIAAHKHVFESLGLAISTNEDDYEITHTQEDPVDEVIMYEASDTATINALLRAARLERKTKISFCTPNYQVQDICFFLEKLGVEIDGIGTSTLIVHGVSDIDTDVVHENSEDPIESMMFISAALVTNSELEITRCPIDFLKLELLKLEKMGAEIEQSDEYTSTNGRTKLVDLTVHPSELKALDVKIHALPYPGINADNLPFFVPIATQAEGTTKINDWMWENRAIYFTELNRFGADIELADPHRVYINGPTEFRASQVVCPPALRPSVIILIAMLAAEGTSVLRNVYSIQRGYENIAERLNDIGADIEIMHNI
ncbi:MAG: UDP-N-acetylglucosamine 1-carboxyvinyltransferase [Candidatus Paceibacterota bacterium]